MYIAMACYEGESLRDRIKKGPIEKNEALDIAIQVAQGMAKAHAKGIVHRDIKPANILVTSDGVAKVVDFGLAKLAGQVKLTREGTTIGTVAYMSPEQAKGEAVDQRTDIWSLGIVLYEMLTGVLPFKGEYDQSLIHSILHQEPERLAKLRKDLPPGLENIIFKALAKKPSDRYQSMDELLEDLQSVAEGLKPVRAASIIFRGRILGFKKAYAYPMIAGVAILAVLAGLLIFRKSSPGLDPDLIAVAVFENQTGDSSLDPLGRMASDWIFQGLSQIESLKIVPTISMLQLLPLAKPGEKTSPALFSLQALAEQTGAGKVVSGTYYLAGGEIQFISRITDTQKRKLIFSLEPVKGSLANKMDIIEKLRQRIMGALAPDLGFSFGAWKSARPPSYEAYQEFILGMNSYGSDFAKAIGHLEKIVKLDPGFMPARLWLARSYSIQGQGDKAVSTLEFMDQNRDKLTREMALFLDLSKADSQGKSEEALRIALQLHKLAPHEALYTFRAAIQEIAINKPRQAIDLFEKVEVTESWLKDGGWFGNWSIAHYLLGNHKKELEVIRRARKYFPDDLAPMAMEARALAALGRIEEVKKVVDESLLSRSSVGTWTAGRVMLAAAREMRLRGYQEDFKDMARRAVEWYRGRPAGQAAAEQQRSELAAALYVSEQWAEAGARIEKLRSERPDDIEYLGYGGALAARSGHKEVALKISEELNGIDRPFIYGEQTYWRARIAALLGMKEEAVELLRQSFAQGNGYSVFIIQEADFGLIRDYAPFIELMKPKG